MNKSNPPGTPDFLSQLSPNDLNQEANDPLAALVRALHETDDPNTTDEVVPDEVVNEVLEQFRLDQLLEEACVASGAAGGAIALFQEGKLVCRAVTGSNAPQLGSCLDSPSGLLDSCVQTRRPQNCSDTENDPNNAELSKFGAKSIAVFPLIDGEQLSGVMEILSSSANAFTEGDLDRVQTLAKEIGHPSAGVVEAAAEPPLLAMSALSSPRDAHALARSEEDEVESSIPVSPPESWVRTNELRTTVLGLLVIIASLLLGGSVGWRLGWQKATLQMRRGSSTTRAGEPSKIASPDSALLPNVTARPALESTPDDERQTADGIPRQTSTRRTGTDSQDGALTIRQNGKLILRVPPRQTQDPQLRDRRPAPSPPTAEGDHVP